MFKKSKSLEFNFKYWFYKEGEFDDPDYLYVIFTLNSDLCQVALSSYEIDGYLTLSKVRDGLVFTYNHITREMYYEYFRNKFNNDLAIQLTKYCIEQKEYTVLKNKKLKFFN